MGLDAIIPILIVGGLSLLSFLKLTNVTRVNRRANIYFGIFTLLWASFWLDEMIIPEDLQTQSAVFTIIHFLQFLVPLTFYFSIKIYANPSFAYSWTSLWYVAVPLIFLGFLIAQPYLSAGDFQLIYIILFMAHSLFYTLWAYRVVQKHQHSIQAFHSSTEDIDLRWIKYIIYAFISCSVVITIYNIFTSAQALNLYINLFFLGVVYLVSFYSLSQKEIYPKGTSSAVLAISDIESILQEAPTEKTAVLSAQELAAGKQALLELMERKAPYLDSELNLIKLAEMINISSHQLSYLINTGLGTNFFNFINGYRVRKAKELLSCEEHRHLNMLVIGYESGFNSKTAFNTTFKKVTSLTPSEYRRTIK